VLTETRMGRRCGRALVASMARSTLRLIASCRSLTASWSIIVQTS
jgi:hypothetical protein